MIKKLLICSYLANGKDEKKKRLILREGLTVTVFLFVCLSVTNWVVHVNRKLASWGIIIGFFPHEINRLGISWNTDSNFMKTGLVHHVSQQLSLKSPLTAQYSVLHVVYLSPGMLFTFPQGCLPFPRVLFMLPQWCFLPLPKDVVYLSLGMLFSLPQGCCLPFPRDIVYFFSGMLFACPQGCCLLFLRDVVYLSPGIPQGCHLPFPRVNPKQVLLVY